MKLKLIKNKRLLLFIVLLFSALIFREALTIFLKFNIELESGGEFDPYELRAHLVRGALTHASLKFNFTQVSSIFLPIINLTIAWEYLTIKKKHLIFNIGKNQNYFAKLENLKLNLSLLSSALNAFVLTIVVLMPIVLNTVGDGQLSLDHKRNFSSTSVLRHLFTGHYGFLIFVCLISIIGNLVMIYTIFCLADFLKNYTKLVIVFLMYFWLGSILSYNFFSEIFAPMHVIMASAYIDITLLDFLVPYWSFIIIIVSSKLYLHSNKYEV